MRSDDKTYDNHQLWQAEARARAPELSPAEIAKRQQLADTHNAANDITDEATLRDQQLYIQGFMELDEYQQYLLLKNSRG